MLLLWSGLIPLPGFQPFVKGFVPLNLVRWGLLVLD